MGTTAVKDGELSPFNTDQAFLKAGIEEIYTDIPEEYKKFLVVMGRLNKAM